MRLVRIEELDYRVFRRFAWVPELLDFADFNLIYAPNGSGKSTIARVIRMASDGNELDEAVASLRLDDGSLLEIPNDFTELESRALPIHVFDQSFRTQALDSLHGIRWSIGIEDVARQKKLERITLKRSEDIASADAIALRAEDAQASLDEFLEARNIEIRELHEIIQPRASYGAQRVQRKFEELTLKESNLVAVTEKQQNARELVLRDTTSREALQKQDWSQVVLSLGAIESAAAELISRTADRPSGDWNEVALDEWLVEGMQSMQEHSSDDCPFCRQPVPIPRAEHLAATFDSAYISLRQAVEDERDSISQTLTTVSNLQLPAAADFERVCVDSLKLVAGDFKREVALVTTWLGDVDELLELRLRDLSAKASSPIPKLAADLPTLLDSVNSLIDEHNSQLSERTNRRAQARDILEAEIYRRDLPLYTRLAGVVGRETEELASKRREIAESDAEVTRLSNTASDTADSADLMTEQLERYLGHGHLTVEPADGGYQILRDGDVVEEVSEGERTAITLIHFLQSLNDDGADRENSIVMIDDPVSSMDSSSIHLAFAFLTTAIHQASSNSVRGQVFLATHNFVFFRLLRDWARHLRGGRKENEIDRPMRFYELRVEDGERRSARLVPMHPLLLRFNSEYHYVFSRLVEFDPEVDLLVVPTLARRLLEAFLAFKVPDWEGDLRRQIDAMLEVHPELGEEQQMRLRSLCNTGSHADRIPVLSRDLGPVDEAPGLVAAVLRFIEVVDSEHFRRMRKLVADAVPLRSTTTEEEPLSIQ